MTEPALTVSNREKKVSLGKIRFMTINFKDDTWNAGPASLFGLAPCQI